MPLQLYDKEQILNTCLEVFSRHGYEKTSTVMLAEAAGISRPLLIHHFQSKKALYLSLLDRCFEKAKTVVMADATAAGLEAMDFFEAREKFSLMKFAFQQQYPQEYGLLIQAAFSTPPELKTEIEARYGGFLVERNQMWQRWFERVPLKEGIDRGEAFGLVMLALDDFDNRYLARCGGPDTWNAANVDQFLTERRRFLAMVRFGFEQETTKDSQ